MTNFTPREIVSELDKFIIGQDAAKRAVAIALRNRWRRQKLDPQMAEEVIPKNILMIGPTGVGKTEISRRLAKLADAPFLKVEATKYTEIGFVGRDVEQIIRDLVEISINMISDKKRKQVEATAYINAENRVIEALRNNTNIPNLDTKEMRSNLRNGEYDEIEVEIVIEDKPNNPFPQIEIPGMPGAQMGMLNIGDILGKGFGGKSTVAKKMSVKVSYDILLTEESEKLLDKDTLIKEALITVENSGIVFLDEIDKICGKSSKGGAEISREGVQRDLLPLIEGTTVSTKHGNVKTDHILFISSGAFHVAKPSDLLPELQGRLPIRVELGALSKDDFVKILCETKFNLIMQYQALIGTEGAEIEFSEDGIDKLAQIAVDINGSVENIGARRLHTVIEKVLDNILFEASDMTEEKIIIDAKYIDDHIGDLAKNIDLSRYIL